MEERDHAEFFHVKDDNVFQYILLSPVIQGSLRCKESPDCCIIG